MTTEGMDTMTDTQLTAWVAEQQRLSALLTAQREQKAKYPGNPGNPMTIRAERRIHKKKEQSNHWLPATDGDDRARALYLRHYSAKKNRPAWKKSRQFLKPGGKMLLLTVDCSAVFAWVKQEYRKDGQDGVECTIFRNEGPILSSDLIREADSLADDRWPNQRHFTYVDPEEVESTNPGYCFLQAGWRRLPGVTPRGLIVLERSCQQVLPCSHRWKIPECNGSEWLTAVCFYCGATKLQRAYWDETPQKPGSWRK